MGRTVEMSYIQALSWKNDGHAVMVEQNHDRGTVTCELTDSGEAKVREMEAEDKAEALAEVRRTVARSSRIVLSLLPTGSDVVYLHLPGPSPFPEIGYEPCLKVDVRRGYGLKWVRDYFGRDPDEVINARDPDLEPEERRRFVHKPRVKGVPNNLVDE